MSDEPIYPLRGESFNFSCLEHDEIMSRYKSNKSISQLSRPLPKLDNTSSNRYTTLFDIPEKKPITTDFSNFYTRYIISLKQQGILSLQGVSLVQETMINEENISLESENIRDSQFPIPKEKIGSYSLANNSTLPEMSYLGTGQQPASPRTQNALNFIHNINVETARLTALKQLDNNIIPESFRHLATRSNTLSDMGIKREAKSTKESNISFKDIIEDLYKSKEKISASCDNLLGLNSSLTDISWELLNSESEEEPQNEKLPNETMAPSEIPPFINEN